MKNLTQKLGLLALVVLVMSSCKPKIDMDFVNSLVGSQSKITESIAAIKSGNASMESFKETMIKQSAEMAKGANPVDASGLMSQVTSLLGSRGNILTKVMGFSTTIGSLITKYKSGGLKMKDAKAQFDALQGNFTGAIGEVGESDQKFAGIRDQFTSMYKKYMETVKK